MSSWADLVDEASQPPVWSERFALSEVLMLSAQVWRTARMDVMLLVRHPSQIEAGSQIYDELVRQILSSLDYTAGGIRVTLRLDIEEDPWRQTHKLILQVDEGPDLEGPINLIDRFKKAWV